uniref:Uncharacterized protein n=1 Tax=Cyprinodon variegatus TaxID=28743 RepID=A0A3Q2CLN4_CYPVA
CVSDNPVQPQYYQLSNNETTVCLATGFTRHNQTEDNDDFKDTSASPIRDYNGNPTGYYNQVAFPIEGQSCNGESYQMVNLASLTIFGLRVIFMKTVIFNVLMTLRLWISQCEYRTAPLIRAQTGSSVITMIMKLPLAPN